MLKNETIEYEHILDYRAVKQPSPAIVSGGDCGLCCLAGLIGCTVEEAYDIADSKRRDSLSHPSMETILRCNKRIESALTGTPVFIDGWDRHHMQFGLQGIQMGQDWFELATMAIRAGYVGMCSINIDGGGPRSLHNHWVMLCGVKKVYVEHIKDGKFHHGSWDHYVYISCSAKYPGGRWYDVDDFLKNYGGFNTLWAIPKVRLSLGG